MATNYQATGDIKVYLGTEATFGTATAAANGDWFLLPVTSYTMPEVSSPVEVAAQRSGHYVNTATQAVHRPDQKIYTFDLTLKGTATSILKACQLMFEDGASEADLTGNYAFPKNTYKDGTASTTQMTVLFADAGADATLNDFQCVSCVATGMTIAQDIGSEGGQLTCTVNLMTAYQPTHATIGDVTATGGTYTIDSGTPKNIRDLTTTTLGGETMIVSSWEISLARTIERIHYSETTNFKPFGYAMTGAIDVTGSLTVKRDDEVHDLLANFKDGSKVILALAEASNFTIDCPQLILNEASADVGGSYLMETIPFTALATEGTPATTILGITIA